MFINFSAGNFLVALPWHSPDISSTVYLHPRKGWIVLSPPHPRGTHLSSHDSCLILAKAKVNVKVEYYPGILTTSMFGIVINVEWWLSLRNITIWDAIKCCTVSWIIMSSFFSRYSRHLLYAVVATSGLYLLYRFYKNRKNNNADELHVIGLELRRRRVEKLVELRDKLVCKSIFKLSKMDKIWIHWN